LKVRERPERADETGAALTVSFDASAHLRHMVALRESLSVQQH